MGLGRGPVLHTLWTPLRCPERRNADLNYDLTETAGLLRVGGEISAPDPQRLEVVDGYDTYAVSPNSTSRGADPALSA